MASASVDWLQLPPEIWLSILKNLGQHELCTKVSKTCSMLRKYTVDSSLWKHLDLNIVGEAIIQDSSPEKGCQNTIEKILNAIIDFENVKDKIRSLTFSRYNMHSDARQLIFVDQFKNLTELDVGFSTGICTESLEKICQQSKGLKSLNIEGSKYLTDDSLIPISLLSKLERLNVSYCAMLTDQALKTLNALSANFISFSSDGVMRFTDYGVTSFISAHTQLESLILDGEGLTDVVCECAAHFLKNLKQFELSFCEEMTDFAIIEIGKMKLKQLKMKKLPSISSNIMRSVFNTSSSMLLTDLIITDMEDFGDDVMFSISSSCFNLNRICIDWCWSVSDLGVNSVILNCLKLTHLSFIGLIHLRGTLWLPKIPELLPDFVYLNLSECRMIDDEALYKLVKRVPQSRVFSYYHERVTLENPPSSYFYDKKSDNNNAIDKSPSCAGEIGVKFDF